MGEKHKKKWILFYYDVLFVNIEGVLHGLGVKNCFKERKGMSQLHKLRQNITYSYFV